MSELLTFLQSIDDDYLVGLSNKGIVKRSYKDLENESVALTEDGESINGTIGEIETKIVLPLTGSTCSCPAGSVCKHIVMTILAAKKKASEAVTSTEPGMPAQAAEAVADTMAADDNIDAATNVMAEKANTDPAADAIAATPGTEAADTGTETAAKPEQAAGEKTAQEPGKANLMTEKLLGVSVDEIKKAALTKEWKAAVRLLQDEKPMAITEGSLITVTGEDCAVKLAYPLALSICSLCHDEKFCRHKTWALLSLQLERGKLTEEELADGQEENDDDWDVELIRDVLPDLQAFLREILLVGCARLSPETPYSLERFAIRAQNAGLASLVGKLRALAEQVRGYQERKVKVTVAGLLRRLCECCRIVEQTEKALENGQDLTKIAGAFRSAYEDVPDLHLCGVGMREFESDAGFAGKILYFLEEETGDFYTYTIARPTIYDKKTRAYNRPDQSPWDLPCTLSQLSRSRILLRQGKANEERRLSATSRAKADLLGMALHPTEENSAYVYTDFERLWSAYLQRVEEWRGQQAVHRPGAEPPETDRLFLIRPQKIIDMEYVETEQKLVFTLEDTIGRLLRAQLTYSKQEKLAIQGMERLMERIRNAGETVPVFLGSLYLEDGECVLYPIETL